MLQRGAPYGRFYHGAYGSSIQTAYWVRSWSWCCMDQAGGADLMPVPRRGGVQAHIPLHSTKTTCWTCMLVAARRAEELRMRGSTMHGIRLVHTGRMLVYVLVQGAPRIRPWSGGSRGGRSRPAHPDLLYRHACFVAARSSVCEVLPWHTACPYGPHTGPGPGPKERPHTALVRGVQGRGRSRPTSIRVSMSNQAAAPTGKGRRLQVARYVQAACSNCVRVHAACDPALPCQ